MSLLPLTLGVGHGSSAGGGSSKAAKSESDAALKRDDYTCRFCGFRSTQYQRTTKAGKETVTICGFCDLARGLERTSNAGAGILTWLPELTQIGVNHLARAIYVAQADDSDIEIARAANRAHAALIGRRYQARRRIGIKKDDIKTPNDPDYIDEVHVLAMALSENMNDAEREVAAQKLDGIRLFPLNKYLVRGKSGDFNGFPQMVAFWRSPQGPFAKLPVSEWQALFDKVKPA